MLPRRKAPILVAGRPVGHREKYIAVAVGAFELDPPFAPLTVPLPAVAALLSVLTGTLISLAIYTVITALIVGAHAVAHIPANTLVAEVRPTRTVCFASQDPPPLPDRGSARRPRRRPDPHGR